MTRRLAVCLGAVLLALPVLGVADPSGPDQPEPPLRLRKKHKLPAAEPPAENKPKPKPEEAKKSGPKEPDVSARKPKPGAKAGRPGGDDAAEGKDPRQAAEEALAEASREMREVQERLAKKDAGEGTQELERDILKRLDTLLQQQQRQQQQQQQQQSQSSSSNSRNQRNAGGSRRQQNAGRQTQTARRQRPGTANQQKRQAGPGNDPGNGGPASKEQMGKIADLFKDRWGHLPETLRQEMDQYSRERFMPKYEDLLKQYYATVAEKGRRKAP